MVEQSEQLPNTEHPSALGLPDASAVMRAILGFADAMPAAVAARSPPSHSLLAGDPL
jgi:hypothetical protein